MQPYRVNYQTLTIGDTDIHLRTLKDKQQYYDPTGEADRLGISSANWSLFGIVWPSSLVLAYYLQQIPLQDVNVLEIGCGIALSSIMLNKLGANVTAMDYHPEAKKFLTYNQKLNNNTHIPFIQMNWRYQHQSHNQYDLVIGSDLLYEVDQLPFIAQFIDNHTKTSSQVILVDPNRGLKTKFSKLMLNLGFNYQCIKPESPKHISQEFIGSILIFNKL